MKKVIYVLIGATMLSAAMVGCSGANTSTSSLTYNGITKTVTTTTKDGKSQKETTYTNEEGKTLSAKEGKAAFDKAKAEVESVDMDF